MREELIQLADTYLKAGEAIHDAIRESVRKAGGLEEQTALGVG